MPIYEYQCESCGHRSEAIQRLAEAKLSECGECGGPLRRLISAPAVQFKGTGWYVTDYSSRKGSSSEADKDKSESKESSSPKADGAAEKSAATPAAKPSE